MVYYPKNKIQQNLQTNGDEYKTIINYNNKKYSIKVFDRNNNIIYETFINTKDSYETLNIVLRKYIF